jgi:hypothetical protein
MTMNALSLDLGLSDSAMMTFEVDMAASRTLNEPFDIPPLSDKPGLKCA